VLTQVLADGLDGYDIVANARIVGKDLCLIGSLVEANIVIVEISRLIDLLVGQDKHIYSVLTSMGTQTQKLPD
jgi:hypothetical protein